MADAYCHARLTLDTIEGDVTLSAVCSERVAHESFHQDQRRGVRWMFVDGRGWVEQRDEWIRPRLKGVHGG